jgi:hypothetical protein
MNRISSLHRGMLERRRERRGGSAPERIAAAEGEIWLRFNSIPAKG